MSTFSTLTAEELRVLACLIEKSHTTPDQYPLSSNGLTTACNQKSSRDPVVQYSTQEVDRTLQLLRDAGWVRMIRGSGNRTFKHKHVVDEKLGLTTPQQAVLAVLALRGPQSAGELKTRTERYHPFEDPADVERVLETLRSAEPPLTANVGRASGQSQDRWVQLLGPAGDSDAAYVPPPPRDPAADVPARAAAEVSSDPVAGAEQPLAPPERAPAGSVRSEGAPPLRAQPSAPPVAAPDTESIAAVLPSASPVIDGLAVPGPPESAARRLHEVGLHGVVIPVAAEDLHSLIAEVGQWNRCFAGPESTVVPGRSADDIRRAAAGSATAVHLALADPAALEHNVDMVEICFSLGIRLVSLSDGRQSRLATGRDEDGDAGLSRLGHQVVAELDRLGMAIDVSRSGQRSALDAIERATSPVAVTWWPSTGQGHSSEVRQAVVNSGGVIGISLRGQDLPDGAATSLERFCELVADAADAHGTEHVGIASNTNLGSGEGPAWFDGGRGLPAVAAALSDVGFLDDEVAGFMGGNWLRFYDRTG